MAKSNFSSKSPIKIKVAYAKILFLRDRERFKLQPVFTRTLRGSNKKEGVYDSAMYYFFTSFGRNKPSRYEWKFTSSEGKVDNVLQIYPFDTSKFYADPANYNDPTIYDNLIIPQTDSVVVIAHYFNAFQRDVGEWAGIRAEKDIGELRLIVDFSSVITPPNKELFKEEPTAYLSDPAEKSENMVTPLDYNAGKIFVASKRNVLEGSVLKFRWKINWDDLATWQAVTKDARKTTPDWPSARTQTISRSGRSQNQMIQILFLAANPKDMQQLQLNKEYKRIDEELQKSKERDKFDLQQRQEVSVKELPELLLRFSPQIVHFSGHGSQESALVFQNDDGSSQTAPPPALTKLFEIINRDEKIIQCVVLNACYAERQAEAISKYVPCVVGMSNAITDEAAIIFAASFYRGLGYGRSVNDAFDFGCNDIDIQNIPEEATPRLKYAPGVDPAKVYLTKAASKRRQR